MHVLVVLWRHHKEYLFALLAQKEIARLDLS
jgi:hypothetical protein